MVASLPKHPRPAAAASSKLVKKNSEVMDISVQDGARHTSLVYFERALIEKFTGMWLS